MNAVKRRFSLEMTVRHSQAEIHIKKGDTKNKLLISLTENGQPYEITENLRAVFVGKKPDGKIVFNDCNIVGNTIEYTITAQTSVAVGIVACELRLYDNNNNLLTSPRFTVVVDETIYDENEVEIESVHEINVIDSLITEANALLEANKRGEFNGATFTPSINDAGVLSWSNDGGLENPAKFYLYLAIVENAGWSRIYNGTDNLIGDNRWYKIKEYDGALTIGVYAITTEGIKKSYSITLDTWTVGLEVIFRLKECIVDENNNILVKIDSWAMWEAQYSEQGYKTQEFTISADEPLGKIDGVYFIHPLLYRNGAADGKDGADGTTVDLSEYLAKTTFNDYMNGAFIMSSPLVAHLAVIESANFEGPVTIQEPTSNNNPATKNYVDNLLNYFNGDYTIPLAIINKLGVVGTATFEDEVLVPPPKTDYNPATKKYVDDAMSTAINNLPIYNGEVETDE